MSDGKEIFFCLVLKQYSIIPTFHRSIESIIGTIVRIHNRTKRMLTLISIIFGALVGSFLNVCIYRLPKEESIVWPGSHCPHCKNPIKFYDNIPLISYLLLRGKCRYCKGPISAQYPLVEGITALSSLVLFMRFGLSLTYLIYFAFVAALIVITVIDLYHQPWLTLSSL